MSEGFKLKLIILFHLVEFFCISFFIIYLINNHFGLGKTNSIDISNNMYINYEKNKDYSLENDYIEKLYSTYSDKVRMSKAKRIEKFMIDNENDEIKMLDEPTRDRLAAKFRDTVIVGDSIAQQVLYMIFKDEYYVKAKRGVAIPKMGELIDAALEQKPRNLVFLKGLNDAGYYRDVDEFISHYEAIIEDIKKRDDKVKIFICSVLPPSKELLASNGSLWTWDLQNQACKVMCERQEITYVDTLFMFKEDANMRNPDGMHYTIQYYDKWLQYMDIILNY